ncbi:DUF4330 domain-containing protein [Tissierella sp. MB52-C2]|uniref:DUF4330 domain-containing protein n=1 Tax=Tissierella sp. MB52-C2 TaxID=3070999 RepID=UPI00280B7C01|nr:DUF4330 domain-containing protein [Tissierella sp. MB52-C2]WMM23736.1 DUF4330 domain-containing protein [Tissierella sp. MB52-C2]
MIIDNKGRIFGKISIIDIVFVLIGLFLGALVLFKLGFISSNQGSIVNNNKVEIVFYQEEVNNFSSDNVHIGDPASEALQNASFGNVTDIKIGESVSWDSTVEGKQFSASREGYSSIYISMEAYGTLGSNGINLGGSTYYIGQTITLRAGNSVFYGKIYSADKI